MALNGCAMGKRIKTIRQKKGYSQNTLSEMIDKTPTYLSYIESGTKTMSLDTFVDIVNALNVTADEVLRDSLENTVIITSHEFSEIISDCSSYEQRVLLDVAEATKNTLRTNRGYILRRKR